ncbi:probable NAD(P)H dehydrogenase (quinone) FQR1-like 2 [Lycium ferocissimum]|uniref:probable NAD(P)H dehydrogenase (quinone) FQR1-like 2 n=1 Tax=Lycium ferocissimum TaxID=112874 RepID=UPI002815D12A|nr:probable NAD(P)H dehydrogenase (quinone) FQR1-like 2 [Lycium ferocissimum]
MGKGGGCVVSKNKIPKSSNKYASSAKNSINVPSPTNNKSLKVFIVFYSMYGHVESLAKMMKKGIETVDGVEGVLYRVPETLPEDVLVQMQAPPKDDSIPEISSPSQLADADGFLFGFPTRFGCMAAQMKALFDSTGLLWKEQKLAGKPAGLFVSTGSQGGGQETTAWTAITQLAHHGMLFVPIGYTFGAGMFDMDSVRGGSPYGAGVFAGDGSRKATETELALAEHQGKYMAAVVKKLVHG